MKKNSLFILLFLVSKIFYSIPIKIDSLNYQLKKIEKNKYSKIDSSYQNLLYQLGIEYQYYYPDSAIYFFEHAYKIAGQLNLIDKQSLCINQIGWTYNILGNFKKALNYLHEAFSIAKKIPESVDYNKEKIIAGILANTATILNEQGKQQKALEIFEKAIAINEFIKNKESLCANYYNISLIYIENSKYDKALEYLFKSLKLSEEIQYKEVQSACLELIGISYIEQADYSKGLNYLLKSLEINKTIGNKISIGKNYCNIGIIYDELNQYDKALEYCNRALEISIELDDKLSQADNYYNIGVIYNNQIDSLFKQKKFKVAKQLFSKSLEYYKKALEINQTIQNKRGEAVNYGSIANLYLLQNNFDKAEDYFFKAIKIGESINLYFHLSEFYKNLSELYNRKGDYKKSLQAYIDYIKYKDIVNSEENKKASVQKELEYEFEKKQTAIKLEQEKKDAITKAEKLRQSLLLMFISAIAIAISIIAFIVYRSLKTTKQQKQIIEQQKQIVEQKQKEILDSIQYAKRIQMALLTNEFYIEKHLYRLKNN